MKPKWDSCNEDKKDGMMETGVMNAGFVVKESNVLTKPTCFQCKAGTEIRGATNAVKSKVIPSSH